VGQWKGGDGGCSDTPRIPDQGVDYGKTRVKKKKKRNAPPKVPECAKKSVGRSVWVMRFQTKE